jgi:predicted 3-demethylubiquinone-9 3-methyltransferase (glyoxalase superfamily)
MKIVQRIAPCLWFDGQGGQAAEYYISIFPNSRIVKVARFGKAGREITGGEPGAVLTVAFELDGQSFTALNGGPDFKFSEAISLQIFCDSQKEVDYYWEKLSAGGDPKAQQCGWLKDRYGVSWQVIPAAMVDLIGDGSEGSERAMAALLEMKKLDLAALQRAYSG